MNAEFELAEVFLSKTFLLKKKEKYLRIFERKSESICEFVGRLLFQSA